MVGCIHNAATGGQWKYILLRLSYQCVECPPIRLSRRRSTTHTRAITISLLALRAVRVARDYQGESTIVIPDQNLVSLLEARRPYKGVTGKPFGKIQRLILSLVTPRMSFVFHKPCHLVHCQHSWVNLHQLSVTTVTSSRRSSSTSAKSWTLTSSIYQRRTGVGSDWAPSSCLF